MIKQYNSYIVSFFSRSESGSSPAGSATLIWTRVVYPNLSNYETDCPRSNLSYKHEIKIRIRPWKNVRYATRVPPPVVETRVADPGQYGPYPTVNNKYIQIQTSKNNLEPAPTKWNELFCLFLIKIIIIIDFLK